MKIHKRLYLLTIYMLMLWCLTGCGGQDSPAPSSQTDTPDTSAPSIKSSQNESTENVIYRDNTPICLVPTADGIAVTSNDVASIDYSNVSDGYVCARYTGTCEKVKLRITCPDSTVYTYDMQNGIYDAFPLSSGNGNYEVTVYENITGTSYSTCLYEIISVSIADEFSPFLYPSQYVNFTADSQVVAKGMELASTSVTDLDVITSVYNYIVENITYDYDKAANPPTGYISDIDSILESGTGICLDYAAVMTSMLRSQRIPTHLEVGYAGEAYHAWISVYTKETGWINGIIEFDGESWSLMDPTFGASTGEKELKKFIGDGTNYTVKYIY